MGLTCAWDCLQLRILLTMLEAGDGGEDGYRALATDFIVRTKRAATTIQRRVAADRGGTGAEAGG